MNWCFFLSLSISRQWIYQETICSSALSFVGKFTVPEEFPVEQLYDIYMQKHSLDDLAFAIEFKVSRQWSIVFSLRSLLFSRVFPISKNCLVSLLRVRSLPRKIVFWIFYPLMRHEWFLTCWTMIPPPITSTATISRFDLSSHARICATDPLFPSDLGLQVREQVHCDAR